MYLKGVALFCKGVYERGTFSVKVVYERGKGLGPKGRSLPVQDFVEYPWGTSTSSDDNWTMKSNDQRLAILCHI